MRDCFLKLAVVRRCELSELAHLRMVEGSGPVAVLFSPPDLHTVPAAVIPGLPNTCSANTQPQTSMSTKSRQEWLYSHDHR